MNLTLINFSHPLTEAHQESITTLAGLSIGTLIDRPAQFDPEQPFVPQAAALMDSVGLTAVEWQTLPLVVNPPALASITAVVLAMLSGQCGYLPSIVRMKPVESGGPPMFVVDELINLEEIRARQRKKR